GIPAVAVPDRISSAVRGIRLRQAVMSLLTAWRTHRRNLRSDSLHCWKVPSGRRSLSQFEYSLPHAEAVVAREDQVHGAAVGGHPFGGEAGGLARADVPVVGFEDCSPRAPGLGSGVDRQAAGLAGVAAGG